MKNLFKQIGLFALLACFVQTVFAQQQIAPPSYPSNIIVAKDGSGNYKTIQEAVNSVRDLGSKRVTILIKNGVYREKLVIPSWKTNISLVGESRDGTIITYDDFSGKQNPGGTDAFGKDKFTTYTSYTVLVQGNDIVIENLTIQNTAGRVGQAVALHVEGDRFIIKNSKLLGNQDTLYAAKENSRQYYENCYIEGTTDFIFGEAIAVFKTVRLKALPIHISPLQQQDRISHLVLYFLIANWLPIQLLKKYISAGHGGLMLKPFLFIVN
jgi:pectinesterase